jgi:hypothetical protein
MTEISNSTIRSVKEIYYGIGDSVNKDDLICVIGWARIGQEVQVGPS